MTLLAALTSDVAKLRTEFHAEPMPLANCWPRCEPLVYALHPLAPDEALLASDEPLDLEAPAAAPTPLA